MTDKTQNSLNGHGSQARLRAAIRRILPGGAHVAGSEGLEKTQLKLGIVPLTDAAPIIIGAERGYFARHGLDVEISREPSWANIRDKVAVGALDAAHMLAPMPLAMTLGLGGLGQPMVTALVMNLNGNAVTVSNALYDEMCAADPEAMTTRPLTAKALKAVITARRAKNEEPLTFAMVFPFSSHNYELRYWMASAGIDPDADVKLVVVPPPQMVAHLSAGRIDGFCVGEPWNTNAVQHGFGRILITSSEIWNGRPEKVLGVTKRWAEENPNTHRALLRGLIEAAKWLGDMAHRPRAAQILATPAYTNASLDHVLPSLTGNLRLAQGEPPQFFPDFNVFYRNAATFPWRSQALWFIAQMKRWRQIDDLAAAKIAARDVFQPDLYRAAAGELGIPAPMVNEKIEGVHDQAWVLRDATRRIAMGPDRFFDKEIFDPSDVEGYLARQSVPAAAQEGDVGATRA